MARSTRKAKDCRTPNTYWSKHYLPIYFSYNYFTCQLQMFQRWLSFATAFTSALKSSEWIIQIHDRVLYWLRTHSTNNKSSWNSKQYILQSCTNTKHSSNELWVQRGKGKGQTLKHLLYCTVQNSEECES